MRLFHLSDLHLGKNFRGYDLLEDQAYVLDRVVEALAERKPSLMIIAGDVYDRAIPPLGAIACFDAFLRAAVEAVPGMRIVIIPGNHDSSGRLAFGSAFMADSGIDIVTELRKEPILLRDIDAPPQEGGAPWAAVWALPFLTQLISDWSAEGQPRMLSQDEMMRRAVGAIKDAINVGSDPLLSLPGHESQSLGSAPTVKILAAHCFAAGAVASESETSFVGAAEQVDVGAFAGFDYVALGHLHKSQSPAPAAWYSGSPMAYSMGEAGAEKGYLEVELGDPPLVRFIRIKPLRELRKIRGYFRDLADNPLPEAERGDYIEATLLDGEPVPNAGERLKAMYPRLVGTNQECYKRKLEESAPGAVDRESLDPLSALTQDFERFHNEIRGEDPEPKMAALFAQLAREALNEAE